MNVRHAKSGAHYKTAEYKDFRREVWFLVRLAKPRPERFSILIGRLRMTIHASPPDKRKRDLDNLLKPIIDSLCAAGVYDNDVQIHDLRILRTAGKPGTVNVFIEQIS